MKIWINFYVIRYIFVFYFMSSNIVDGSSRYCLNKLENDAVEKNENIRRQIQTTTTTITDRYTIDHSMICRPASAHDMLRHDIVMLVVSRQLWRKINDRSIRKINFRKTHLRAVFSRIRRLRPLAAAAQATRTCLLRQGRGVIFWQVVQFFVFFSVLPPIVPMFDKVMLPPEIYTGF